MGRRRSVNRGWLVALVLAAAGGCAGPAGPFRPEWTEFRPVVPSAAPERQVEISLQARSLAPTGSGPAGVEVTLELNNRSPSAVQIELGQIQWVGGVAAPDRKAEPARIGGPGAAGRSFALGQGEKKKLVLWYVADLGDAEIFEMHWALKGTKPYVLRTRFSRVRRDVAHVSLHELGERPELVLHLQYPEYSPQVGRPEGRGGGYGAFAGSVFISGR